MIVLSENRAKHCFINGRTVVKVDLEAYLVQESIYYKVSVFCGVDSTDKKFEHGFHVCIRIQASF